MCDCHPTRLSGASAGSLVATLAACSVPTDAAVRLALEIADEAELWTRSAGLAFVWGRLVERWLTQLLPDECGAMVSGRLSLCTLALRPRELDSTRMHITRFESKADIVHAALASVHVPWFMDGNATKLYRGHRCIDGSILAPRDVMIERAAAAAAAGDSSGTATRQRPLILPTTTTLLIDHHCDARIKARRKLVDSFEMVSRARVLEMVEMGHEYARARLERGDDREWNAFRRAVELSSASVPSAVPCSAHTSAANAVKP